MKTAAVRTGARFAATALVLSCSLGLAQAPKPYAEFEVASAKPNKTSARMDYAIRGGTLTARNVSLKGLIQIAYGNRNFQISSGPGWINSECFDVDAKAQRPLKATHDMLKSLLASRFKLELHSETRETSVYSLVMARDGLRMKMSADQSEPEKGGPDEMGPGRMLGKGIPMYVLTNLLSNVLDRAVINNTGLTGKYDVDLKYVPDSAQAPSDSEETQAQADVLDIALMSAVEKRLGLKLESSKARQEVLVIDRVERPSAN